MGIFIGPLGLICISVFATCNGAAQTPAAPEMSNPLEGFRKMVQDVAEKSSVEASDYWEIAQQTIQLGQAAQQSGNPLPDPVIHDALDSIDAGRSLNPLASDWSALENELLKLLEKPEQPPQEQQSNEENSEGEQGESQDGQSGEGQGEEGEPQDQDSEEQGQQPQEQEQEGSNNPQQQQSDSGEQDSPSADEQQSQPQRQGSQIGDLGEEEQSQNAELAPGDEEEQQDPMQSIGGQGQATEKVDPQKAVTLQKLEQLRQQDDPGKLFQILQEAESENSSIQQPNAQDW